MTYSKDLANEIRARIGNHPGLTEKQMFGSIVFMVNGNVAVGVTGDELIVRVGEDAHDEALSMPGTRIFDPTARPMRGWIVVAQEGIATDTDLDSWIERGVSWAEALPSK